ncbi:spinocerebellar ataxia type 10 protein domain-containing protein [Lactarius hatsudake]|nr:spinocerebellar ataxia type 10 protein domain-containing protein [Lactarius hatsudake]
MAAPNPHSQLLQVFSLLNSDIYAFSSALRADLDDLSQEIASNKALRVQLGSQQPPIWAPLHELWNNLTRLQSVGSGSDHTPSQHIYLVVSLAKFTRNFVADVPFNQKNAFIIEPHIRQLIYLYTAWTKDGDEGAFTVTRILAQTLSNLVTGNQELIDQFWDVQMQTSEEKSILIRLTGLPDPRSLTSVVVLVMNCIYDSHERGYTLVSTSIGVRVCVSILDRLEGLLDCPESGDEGKAFELGYGLFSRLFQLGLFPEVYRRTSMQDEVISPSQTTLLKLVDSFLQSIPASFLDEGDHLRNLAVFLASVFLFRAENGRRAIQQVTGTPSPEPRATSDIRDSGGSVRRPSGGAVDLQLSGVCVALVLLSTSLSSILLAERENGGGVTTEPDLVSVTLPCIDAISGSRGPTGKTLRSFDAFLPRINFGKIKPSYPHGDGGGGAPAQSGGEAGFSYLKRDLVRLLGILCYNNKAMQDRVRLCGGIPVVLNLCVIDDRNPYLREHALFAMRNLLHNNSENKAVVDTFRADEHVEL